jgi:hypothetical protein
VISRLSQWYEFWQSQFGYLPSAPAWLSAPAADSVAYIAVILLFALAAAPTVLGWLGMLQGVLAGKKVIVGTQPKVCYVRHRQGRSVDMSVRVQIKDADDKELAVLRFGEMPDVGEEIVLDQLEGGTKVYVVYKRTDRAQVLQWSQSESGIMQGGRVQTVWVNPVGGFVLGKE